VVNVRSIHIREEGKVVAVEVKVQNVKVSRARADFSQHREVGGHVPSQFLVEPQGNLPATDEPRVSLAVAAGKKSYLVTARHQRIGEMRYDALSAAVEFGGNRLVKGSNLCNPHSCTPTSICAQRELSQELSPAASNVKAKAGAPKAKAKTAVYLTSCGSFSFRNENKARRLPAGGV
jgi:hypothetical protein